MPYARPLHRSVRSGHEIDPDAISVEPKGDKVRRHDLVLLLLTACAAPPPPPSVPADAPAGAARQLPTLRLEAEVNVPDLDNLSRYSQVAVSPQGALVFANHQEAQVLRLRHRDGTALAFGSKGQGPGEVNDASFLFVTDSAVVFRDPTQGRLVWFGLDGRPIRSERARTPTVNSSAPIGGSQVLFAWGPIDPRQVVRIDTRNGATSAIDLASDSFASAHWGGSISELRQNRPVPGTWYGGFLLADQRTYTLGFYDWEGVLVEVYQQPGDRPNLPSAEEVERQVANRELTGRPLSPGKKASLEKTQQPWFANSIRQDGVGRTWLLATRFGRVEADVFLGPAFFGSLSLPCEGVGPRWDLTGTWLAIICEPDDPDSAADALVKLFEIQ